MGDSYREAVSSCLSQERWTDPAPAHRPSAGSGGHVQVWLCPWPCWCCWIGGRSLDQDMSFLGWQSSSHPSQGLWVPVCGSPHTQGRQQDTLATCLSLSSFVAPSLEPPVNPGPWVDPPWQTMPAQCPCPHAVIPWISEMPQSRDRACGAQAGGRPAAAGSSQRGQVLPQSLGSSPGLCGAAGAGTGGKGGCFT